MAVIDKLGAVGSRCLAIGFFCISGLSLFFCSIERPQTPNLSCPDLITVPDAAANRTSTVHCDILNISSRPVEILEVYTTCSCANARLSGSIVGPAKSSELTVKATAAKDSSIRAFVTIAFHFVGESEVFNKRIEVRAAGTEKQSDQ